MGAPRARHLGPQSRTAPPPSRCRPIPRRRHCLDRGPLYAVLDSWPPALSTRGRASAQRGRSGQERSAQRSRERARRSGAQPGLDEVGKVLPHAATADHLRTELVADALRAACHTRRPAGPVIFHSDRGCQYTSREFALLASEFGVRLSVGRTGQCWDNALAESFFATLKNELTDARPWPSRTAARTAIFEWIESWYNLQRLHSSLGYRTPADYEAALAA
ncbi:transposase [Streptomyces sp. NPDC001312]|uniref:transposase n=1 Tax=Streptomyces sp. NPDC001312 TaxID=3364561 RepID=UPI0036A57D95